MFNPDKPHIMKEAAASKVNQEIKDNFDSLRKDMEEKTLDVAFLTVGSTKYLVVRKGTQKGNEIAQLITQGNAMEIPLADETFIAVIQ
jgi:hypothetical protein